MGTPHVAKSTGYNEWYTPVEYIEAARAVMGAIDLDPASSELANEIVKAKAIFTKDNNGLEQDWNGRIWMNPPYSRNLIIPFCGKLISSIDSGTVTEAIVLVNNATETQWFQSLVTKSTAILFPNKRIKFWQPDGKLGAPLQGQALLYFGKNVDRFVEFYKDFGFVCFT